MRAEPSLCGCAAGDGLSGAAKEDHLPVPRRLLPAGGAGGRGRVPRWLRPGCTCSRDVCADVARAGQGVRGGSSTQAPDLRTPGSPYGLGGAANALRMGASGASG